MIKPGDRGLPFGELKLLGLVGLLIVVILVLTTKTVLLIIKSPSIRLIPIILREPHNRYRHGQRQQINYLKKFHIITFKIAMLESSF